MADEPEPEVIRQSADFQLEIPTKHGVHLLDYSVEMAVRQVEGMPEHVALVAVILSRNGQMVSYHEHFEPIYDPNRDAPSQNPT